MKYVVALNKHLNFTWKQEMGIRIGENVDLLLLFPQRYASLSDVLMIESVEVIYRD
jgi:hypothetical protein